MVAFATPAWEPRDSDITWTKKLIDAVSDDAMWGTSDGVYRFNKKSKTLTLLKIPPGSDQESRDRIRICFEHLGWTIEEKI
jgi:hypothetical protein